MALSIIHIEKMELLYKSLEEIKVIKSNFYFFNFDNFNLY